MLRSSGQGQGQGHRSKKAYLCILFVGGLPSMFLSADAQNSPLSRPTDRSIKNADRKSSPTVTIPEAKIQGQNPQSQ